MSGVNLYDRPETAVSSRNSRISGEFEADVVSKRLILAPEPPENNPMETTGMKGMGPKKTTSFRTRRSPGFLATFRGSKRDPHLLLRQGGRLRAETRICMFNGAILRDRTHRGRKGKRCPRKCEVGRVAQDTGRAKTVSQTISPFSLQ